MLRALCFGLVVAAAVPVSQWKQKHPQAAQALGKWVQENPQASRKVFAWDGLHPDRTKELVDWAISNADADVVAFHTKHRDWPEFDELLDKHRGALNEFAAWARQHRDAAKDLIENPRGLEWAGKNLYPARSRQARARPAG
jgi:hypothetical protein